MCACISVRMYVCMCMYMCVRLLIISGMIWTPYDWLNKFYSCYMAAVIIINDGRGLGVEVHCKSQPNKSKLSLYKLLLPL